MNDLNGKSVLELGGAVRFDPIFKTYIVRIPTTQFQDAEHLNISLEFGSTVKALKYDASRKIFYNNSLKATAQEDIENGCIVIK